MHCTCIWVFIKSMGAIIKVLLGISRHILGLRFELRTVLRPESRVQTLDRPDRTAMVLGSLFWAAPAAQPAHQCDIASPLFKYERHILFAEKITASFIAIPSNGDVTPYQRLLNFHTEIRMVQFDRHCPDRRCPRSSPSRVWTPDIPGFWPICRRKHNNLAFI